MIFQFFVASNFVDVFAACSGILKFNFPIYLLQYFIHRIFEQLLEPMASGDVCRRNLFSASIFGVTKSWARRVGNLNFWSPVRCQPLNTRLDSYMNACPWGADWPNLRVRGSRLC